MNYMDESAACPFYVEGDFLKIRCEGYCEGTRLHISFDCKARMKAHAKKYCNDIDGCTLCPLYSIIMEQYKGEEDNDE